MKLIKIITLFLLGITAAAFAQENATQITYKRNTTCSQSFCDAFVEDESICEISGNGHALIYERDGECGIEILDAEARCSVQCHYYDVIFTQSPRLLFYEECALAVVLVLLTVGCVVWRCRRRRAKRIEFHTVETSTNGPSLIEFQTVETMTDDDDQNQPSFSVERHDDWDMMGRRNASEKKPDPRSRPMLSQSLGGSLSSLSKGDKTEETYERRWSLSQNL
jgi:hypothetical protein